MISPCLVLAALVPLANDPGFDALVGWYELEPGRHALVTFGASGGLRLFDFERPSFDVLVARQAAAASEFQWQRQHESGAAQIVFEKDGEGPVESHVAGFAWSSADGKSGHARRDEDYGYEQAELRFPSEGVELCALLMLPRGQEKHPGVVILQGSGDSDRDNVWAFSIANALAQSGIAVLLPDKRGCGQSRGDWKKVGFDVLAEDARAGFALLREQQGIDARRVGFVGLSQGGWIAPLAAQREQGVAFVVSVSGTTVTVREQVLHELEQTVRKGAAGAGDVDEQAALARELMGMAFAFGQTGEGFEDYLAGVEAAPPIVAEGFPRARDDWRWAWYARVVDFDPLPLWKALAVPGLVIYGAEDEHDNVPVRESVARLERLGHRNLAARVYADSGHALEDGKTGWVRRDFLAELASWIGALPAR